MAKKVLIVLMLMFSSWLMASPYTVYIKGVVIDTTSGDAVPGAKVQIIARTTWGSLIYSNTLQTDRVGHFLDLFYTDISGFVRITATDSSFGTVDTLMTFSINQPSVSAMIQVVRGIDPCIASFNWQSNQTDPQEIQFTSTSSGTFTKILYDFGDGTTDSTANPIHRFAPGSYNVCLTVSTPMGCFDKRCETVQIADPVTCEVQFTYTQTNAYQIAFQATTTSPYATSFTWLLNEGLQTTGKVITHNFPAAGTYSITLQGVDEQGCEDTFTGLVEVEEQINPCRAAFRYIPDPQNPNLFHFTNASTGEIASWSWNFGDGNSSQIENPHHQFAATGQYDVTLHVENPTSGCNDSVTMPVDVGLGFYYTIAGQVFAGDFPADSTQVDVYRINDGAPQYAGTFTSGPYGIFHFYALTTGTYILKATLKASSPEYGKYLTTYYHRKAFWEDARRINLTADSTNIAFYLEPNPNMTNGPGAISGHIYYEYNGTMRSEIPAGYLPILLFDDGREPIHGVFSLEDGSFEFEDVPEGIWKLQPEITGLSITPLELTISSNNQIQNNLIVTIEESGVTFGIGITDPNQNTLQGSVFPNPTSGNWNLNIHSDQPSEVEIKMLSSDGRVLLSLLKKLSTGDNLLNFSTEEFSAGVYYVVVQDRKGATSTQKLFFK